MKLTKRMHIVFGSVLALSLTLLASCAGDSTSSSASGSGPTGNTGIAGSTARMVIVDNYLYAIAENKIQLFDISTPSSPNVWSRVIVDWDIQTLFPYEDYLLVGAADGIHILDNSDPAGPFLIGDLRHARTIDPVVANSGYAYVTLKNDPNAFDDVDDQMNVVSLADITNPQLIRVIPMQEPEGLSTIDKRLFVCDGRAGLKQFSLEDPENPVNVDSLPDVNCNDVIAFNGILYAITDTSLQQYDYSVSPPALLSVLATESMSADALTAALSSQVGNNKLTCVVSPSGC